MGSRIGFILLLVIKTAAADVITSTFGPYDSFTTFGGYQVGGGARTGHAEELAVAFTPALDFTLTQIRIAVLDSTPATGDHDLILDLSEGALPGPPLETFATTVLEGFGRIYSFNSVVQPELLAGQTYWILLTSNDLVDNFYAWDDESTQFFSTFAERSPRSGSWQLFDDSSPAFEVSGQPVAKSAPEPSLLFTVGMALFLGGIVRSRRRKPSFGGVRQ